MSTFAAIDFETANHDPASACAVGIVIATDGRIVHREHRLIRPPTRDFAFTHIHGLTWSRVRRAEDFGAVWPGLSRRLGTVEFFAAHNAPFDRGVLAVLDPRLQTKGYGRRFIASLPPAPMVRDLSRIDAFFTNCRPGPDAPAALKGEKG